MKVATVSIGLAMLGSLIIAAPVVAWHVDVEPGSRPPKVRSVDPRGDPLARLIINNKRPAWGKVCVPVAKWSQGTVFSVGSKSARAGECIRLRAGRSYEGTWSNSDEVERFTVRDVTPAAKTRWSHVHRKTGKRVWHDYTTPRGCVTRTGWHAIKGGTMMWAWDGVGKRLHFKRRMADDGNYKAPWRGYPVGTTCAWTPA